MQFKKLKRFITGNLLIISFLFVIVGFTIMSIDTTEANGGESFHQLTIAPILLLLGYTLIIFAIMKPGKE